MIRTNEKGDPVIPSPPGLPQSPWAVWLLAVVATAATEALDLSLIGSQTNRIIIGVAGIVVPLVVVAAEAVWRATHTKAIVSAIVPLHAMELQRQASQGVNAPGQGVPTQGP